MTIDPNQIYVNYSQINNVEEDLGSAFGKIQVVLQNLEAQIQPLQATWSGASQSEYAMVQARWNADLTAMGNLLQTYTSALSEITLNYGTTDNNLASQWADIT
jgi:WXG100 family type VII secretion target